MKPVLFKGEDGHPLMVDAGAVLKACWVEGYGPDIQTRILLVGGFDALVCESVEEVAKMLKGD